MMMQARQQRAAFKALNTARRFSTSSTLAARSPFTPAQSNTTKTKKETTKRDASTAAVAQPRATPVPAFNRDNGRPQQHKPQEMDHTFVGMTGGEIFHEMMLRHDVKHVCM